jgi:hypothetical protein
VYTSETHISFLNFLPHIYSMHGTDEKSIQFWSKHLKERDHLEDQGIYGSIILKWAIRKQWAGGGLVSTLD